MFWKWSKRIGVSLLSLIIFLHISGASYQFISTKLDERTYSPPGKLVDVGGYKLHLYSTGSGGPVVILDAGLGCISSDWCLVQPEIAKFAHVISYDRAGTGWSEKSPHPRTSGQIVEELHTLLQNAKIPGPYILVGHSFGGQNIQLFAAKYPTEVAGIVLVDSAHEEQEKRLPPAPWDSSLKLLKNSGLVRFASTFGIHRLLTTISIKSLMPTLSESMQNTHLAISSTTKHCCTVNAEAASLHISNKQLAEVDWTAIRDKPCFILTAGRMFEGMTKFELPENFLQKYQVIWNELQTELASKFKNSRHLIAERSDHMIPWNQPELIVHAVKELSNETKTMNIQDLLQEYVNDHGAVGASVGLIENGTIKFCSYGKKSIDGNEAVSENTIYEIGSITKVFTTLALIDMVTKGEMQLDDPVESYLPGVKIPEMDGKKITLRHLATHSSGLPSLPNTFNPKNPSNPYEDFSIEHLYDFLNHHHLRRAPGEQFEYSNIGMGLLGHILSLKTGKSYEQLISDRISKKLNMNNTAISLTPEMQKQFANGHHLGQIVAHWEATPAIMGAGMLRSNVKDMTQFLAANMGLLNSSITDLLKQCHRQQFTAFPNTDIGLGWIISHSDDADVIWHNGGTGGFRTFLGFNPKTQKGIVVLSNSTEEWPDLFALSLLDPENYKKPIVDEALAKDLNYLKRFEGSYETTINEDKLDITIKLCDSQLIFAIHHSELKLIPESFGVFSMKGVAGQKLHFIFDNNKIVKAQMIFSDNTVAAEAIPKSH